MLVSCAANPLLLARFTSTGVDDSEALAFARRAAVEALTFDQGDRRAIAASRRLFTDGGWKQFHKVLEPWLDPSEAPTFAETFVPAGDGRVVDEQDGVTHVRIPGTLTQSSRVSKTTYSRFAADVWVTGSPLAVERLVQTTCGGASTACE